jgi:rhamnose utilization protein RhaD (predicted bifunctional aldolase and dehydrogenase)
VRRRPELDDLLAFSAQIGRDPLLIQGSVGNSSILPHRVVRRVHSVNTLASALRWDAPERLRSQLRGLRWEWIPYARSGLPLAREIERALGRSSAFDIRVLGNHRLLVCGDDCRSVELVLKRVDLLLGSTPRRAPHFDRQFLLRLVDGSHWRLPEYTRLQVSRRMRRPGLFLRTAA